MRGHDPVHILFLNQMAGPMFRELAEGIAADIGSCLLYTGHPDTLKTKVDPALAICPAPGYNRSNNLTRLFSWVKYFILASWLVFRHNRHSTLFIVSNPPFLGLLGLLNKWLRGQQYVVLVYDVYPDLLLRLGRLREGVIAGVWRTVNRLVYENANTVFTIGEDMADRLRDSFDESRTISGRIQVIPCWADVDTIKPLPKHENEFAREHHLQDKTVVLYSGNLGQSHDIESLLTAAEALRDETGIHFLVIGDGSRRSLVEERMQNGQLPNLTLLPFQPEEKLPLSLTSGDIGYVAYQAGAESCMLPSKTYYYLAAGLAIFLLDNDDNDLATMIETSEVGLRFSAGKGDQLVDALLELHRNPSMLERMKANSRGLAKRKFSKANIALFCETLSRNVGSSNQGRRNYQ